MKKLINSVVNPDFETLFQQNPGGLGSFRIKEKYFGRIGIQALPRVPLISVDPSEAGGPSNSYGVIHVWAKINGYHVLIDQCRKQFDIGDPSRRLKKFIARYRPAAVLIEKDGCGRALVREMSRHSWHRVIDVSTRG